MGEGVGRKLGKAQAPIRVAVTGRTVGPPLFESLEVLGPERTLARSGRLDGPAGGRRDRPRPVLDRAVRVGILATLTGLRLLRFILRVVAFVVALILIYLVVTAVQVWMTSRRYEPRPAGAIVVMGAAQYDGVPSPDLASRLDEAEILWHQHLAPTIMVTGSKEPGDLYTEAQASERYLVAAGIPAGDILEAGGRNTWESLSDAAPTLLARGDRTVLIATDPFHEARCLAIASSLGLVPYPTPTRTSPIKGFSTVPVLRQGDGGDGAGPDHRVQPPERSTSLDDVTEYRRTVGR